jgi:hypothetical protein
MVKQEKLLTNAIAQAAPEQKAIQRVAFGAFWDGHVFCMKIHTKKLTL